MTRGQDAPFGARLRRLREAAGLTQEELAEKAGLTARGISDLERGARNRPYPHTVRSLADALELTEDERAALFAAVPKRGGRPTPSTVPESALLVPPTQLVGREQELREIRELLLDGSEVRLLTLTGIGGVGKTRLALAAARGAEGHFPDGVAFIALAPLRDPVLVVSTIARSLGLREEQGQSAADALHAHLLEKRTLLVLDNFEHLLEAATEVVHLIETCRALVVLATSRAPLRVRGEQEYPVPPLALPPSTQDPTEEEVLKSPSGRLFVERARAASPSFALTSENASSVAAICWRLAGLPLALELAAAKVRFLEPVALLSRLDEALSNAWARDLPERQRTMRATLDWSYDLLSAPERQLFRRLSVFSGGFSLEAAETVGAGEEGGGVLSGLGALVEQSLVAVEPPAAGSEARYGMLEPIRQYALRRLEESGEAEEIGRRHAAYYLALGEAAYPELMGREQVEWLDRLEVEHDNLRAALGWFLARDDVDSAGRLAWALSWFWWVRGHFSEWRHWNESVLVRNPSAPTRAHALLSASTLAYLHADYDRAAPLAEESLALARELGDEEGTRLALGLAGFIAVAREEIERGLDMVEEAVARHLAAGDKAAAALVLTNSSVVPLRRGDLMRAERLSRQGLALAREIGDRVGTYNSLSNLASVARARSDHAGAGRLYGEALVLSVEMGDQGSTASCLEQLAGIAADEGDQGRAARLWGAAEALLEGSEAAGYFHTPNHAAPGAAIGAARARLDEQGFGEAWAEGRAMTPELAVEYALEDDEASPN